MNRRDLRERIAARPNNVRFAELVRLLSAYGFHFHRAGNGNHMICARGGARVTVPYRPGTVLPVYVRHVLRLTEGEDDE